MHFLAKYGGSPDPQTLDLSDFAVEHDALGAAGRLHAVAGFLRALDSLDGYTHPRDWSVDADQLEALADTLTDNVAAEALSRQHAENTAEIVQEVHSDTSIISHHGDVPQTLAPVVAAALELPQAATDTSLPKRSP